MLDDGWEVLECWVLVFEEIVELVSDEWVLEGRDLVSTEERDTGVEYPSEWVGKLVLLDSEGSGEVVVECPLA